MAPSRRSVAASNTTTSAKKLASSSKASTKAKAKGSSKRPHSKKVLPKSNTRLQAVKHTAPSGSLAGGSSNASGRSNGRKSNSQRATGVAAKGSSRKATAAKSGSQAQSQRSSGRKPKTQRLTRVSEKSAPLKPTRRFNAEAAANRKLAQNARKTKNTLKGGRQAGTANQQRTCKVNAQSKENGDVKASLGAKAKEKVEPATKSAVKAATRPAGRKRKAPEEDPAFAGDVNVVMLATDARIEPVRLPLELSKEKVGQGGVGSKLWYVQKYLATIPAQYASITQETGHDQETTAKELLLNTVCGWEEDLEDDSSESSSSESSLESSSYSAASLARRDALLRQLIDEQRKLRLAYEKSREQELEFREQQIKLLESFAKRWEMFITLLDQLCRK